jgi:hypothetical protein
MAIKTASGSRLSGSLPAGLVLLNTTNFTAVASQALPTGSFTSTYKNYQIVLRYTQNTSNATLSARMRANGVNATGADYSFFGSTSGYSAGPTRVNVTGGTSWGLVTPVAGNIATVIFDITSPQVANQTVAFMKIFSTSAGDDVNISAQHGQGISYDSIDFIAAAGTITGQVSVYGYNE